MKSYSTSVLQLILNYIVMLVLVVGLCTEVGAQATLPQDRYNANYAPFSVDWGFAMTEARLRSEPDSELQIKAVDLSRLINMLKSDKREDTLHRNRMGLIVRNANGSDLLMMDANGGVWLDGEEFGISPSKFLRVSLFLGHLKDAYDTKNANRTIPNPSIVGKAETAKSIARALCIEHYSSATEKSFRYASVLQGDHWVVTASPQQRPSQQAFRLIIMRSNGMIISTTFRHPK